MPIDKKNYPTDWPQIRKRIMERSGGKCEHCGIDRYTVYYLEGGKRQPMLVGETYREANTLRHRMMNVMQRKVKVIRLTTAHLHHDEWNDNVKDSDLACLCEKCHFAHDKVDNQLRKRYGKQYKREQLNMFSE